MKMILLRVLFFLVPFLWSIYVCSQPANIRDCATTCFSSRVVSVEKISPTCTSYEMNVFFSGNCAHALSHFAVAIPCGSIQDIWNSENWKQVVGADPTTGLNGFKIDDIPSFGETSLKSFTVRFTVCSSSEACSESLACWQPVVAYKAATCINYDTLEVSCRNLKASLQKEDVSCFSAQDGSLTVVVEDGQEPFSFSWSDNSTAQSLTGLSPGDYSVTVRDASGAELKLSGSIKEPPQIAISNVTTDASCNGMADGAIDITVSGGTGGYTFLWDGGAETEDVDHLTSGLHSVTVTDATGCTSTSRFVIGNISNIIITATQVRPDCSEANGSIDVSLSGGTAPYSFMWSNGATTEDLLNVESGLYSVTVTDASGCSKKAAYSLTANNTLKIAGVSSSTSCANDASGGLDLAVTGGTEPYSYLWSNGETSEDLAGLQAGYYTVTVTDAKGCTAYAGFIVSKKTLQVNQTIKKPTCHDSSDGSITLDEPIGGTAPYTYEWSNGGTGTSITGIPSGLYSVTITDAMGCSQTLAMNVTSPNGITASASVANSECNAEGFFSVDLIISGGTAPYTFHWSDGNTSEDRDHLGSGLYSVDITDANGCAVSKEIAVQPSGTSWSCLINDPGTTPVCGSPDNALTSFVTDGDSYVWSLISTDGRWSLSSNGSPSVLYTAGGEGSSATFTLTIQKDGCSQTCTRTVTTCAQPDGNGEGPGNEDPGEGSDGGDQSCEECFSTTAKLLAESDACHTYEMQVSTTGLCRHELSHWTLAIPCGTVSNYSNSQGWKMEFGRDPTTGLYGLKVNDIDGFGKTKGSFTVRFTVCETTACDLSTWDPMVAYKAGLCVSKETLTVSSISSPLVNVYPNPFGQTLTFEWTSGDGNAKLLIIDQYGNTVAREDKSVSRNGASSFELPSASLPRGMYYYSLTIGDKIFRGKILKK
jgi:hypothetical protein